MFNYYKLGEGSLTIYSFSNYDCDCSNINNLLPLGQSIWLFGKVKAFFVLPYLPLFEGFEGLKQSFSNIN